ncbi:MAG: hypothetical protein OH337_04115 [Candidatus Parvarchaeota archaeon]|nr:hypothetical protein [Candidatus Haiyanarchaeum thermophilum]
MYDMEYVNRKNSERKELLRQLRELNRKTRELKQELWTVEQELTTAREKLGEEKGKLCPALRLVKDDWGYYAFTCIAKELKRAYSNRKKLFRNICYRCRLSRDEIIARVMFKRIIEGK